MIVPADGPNKTTPLLTGPANDGGAVFSPDGRWIAFTSDRSGRGEAYVVRFRGDQSPPALGGHPLQISSGGGGVLAWRRDGRELLLVSQDERILAVAMDSRGESITAGQPVPLFTLPPGHRDVAISPEADRFLITEYPHAAGQTIHLLTNWHERIK